MCYSPSSYSHKLYRSCLSHHCNLLLTPVLLKISIFKLSLKWRIEETNVQLLFGYFNTLDLWIAENNLVCSVTIQMFLWNQLRFASIFIFQGFSVWFLLSFLKNYPWFTSIKFESYMTRNNSNKSNKTGNVKATCSDDNDRLETHQRSPRPSVNSIGRVIHSPASSHGTAVRSSVPSLASNRLSAGTSSFLDVRVFATLILDLRSVLVHSRPPTIGFKKQERRRRNRQE